MNVLVTGGAGYIGSHTAKALATAGHNPVVYDNLSRGYDWAVKWGQLVRGNLADSSLLESTLTDFRIHAVLHFAAYAYVGESVNDPGLYFENNCVGSLRLLEAMVKARVSRIVFSSTCASYGEPERIPIDELHPQAPINPYGESKLFVEKLLRWYGVAHGLEWIALRYFNAAGADPDGEIGECHNPETHLIPLLLKATGDSRTPVSVFGTDYPTPDGTAIRDYIHVADVAQAHILALEYLVTGGSGQCFNLGSGQGRSVREVIETITKVTGHLPATVDTIRRIGDPHELVADATRAKSVLNWKPKYSSLGQIVETAWRWHIGLRPKVKT